jgi:hypothetical protein
MVVILVVVMVVGGDVPALRPCPFAARKAGDVREELFSVSVVRTRDGIGGRPNRAVFEYLDGECVGAIHG